MSSACSQFMGLEISLPPWRLHRIDTDSLSEIEEIGFFPELLHADLLFSKQSSKQMQVVISNQFV